MVNVWDILGDHAVRKNTKLLEKAAIELDPDQLEFLKNFYKNFAMPSGYKRRVNQTISKKMEMPKKLQPPIYKTYEVKYDEFGFPDFIPVSPRALEFKFGPINSLVGESPDMLAANEHFAGIFGVDNFKKRWRTVNGVTKPSTTCDILITDPITGNKQWVQHTWHHMQDGKTMIPVPSHIHNSGILENQGFAHTATAVIKSPNANVTVNLKGFFELPPDFD
jgi:hypothetical protein